MLTSVVHVGYTPVRLDGAEICHDLVALWEQHARSPRMATPILKTLNVLLSRGVLDKMCLKAADADQLVHLIRGEGRKCSDAPRLVCIADALCQLAVVGQGDVTAALQVRLYNSLLNWHVAWLKRWYLESPKRQIIRTRCPQAGPRDKHKCAGFDGAAHIQATNCEEGCCRTLIHQLSSHSSAG